MSVQPRLLRRMGEPPMEPGRRMRRTHHEQLQLNRHPTDHRREVTPVDLGRRARRMLLRHHHRAGMRGRQLQPQPGDHRTHSGLADHHPVLSSVATPDPLRGMTLLHRIHSNHGPDTGAGRLDGAARRRGHGASPLTASRTSRRWTLNRVASSRTENSSSRRARRIRSLRLHLGHSARSSTSDDLNSRHRRENGCSRWGQLKQALSRRIPANVATLQDWGGCDECCSQARQDARPVSRGGQACAVPRADRTWGQQCRGVPASIPAQSCAIVRFLSVNVTLLALSMTAPARPYPVITVATLNQRSSHQWHRGDRPAGVLLRDTQPLAATHEREQQRPAGVDPKGTDLSKYPTDHLQHVANELNERLRKALNWDPR